MIKQGVIVVGTNQRTGKDHGVEGYVVLGHELVELYLLRVLPPFLPILRVAGRDGEIAAGMTQCDRV